MPEIIYKDDHYIALNKPAGILVIPAPGKPVNLTDEINTFLSKSNSQSKAHPCHRLDAETSGCIIYSLGKAAQKKMMDMFQEHSVHKEYIALINGNLKKDSGEIRFQIDGKEALTIYNTLWRSDKCSLVRINLLTGRTNQIRIHFKMLGHPLIGDAKFENRKNMLVKFKRTALHSLKIGFTHPYSGHEINISAPLPDDLIKLFNTLQIDYTNLLR